MKISRDVFAKSTVRNQMLTLYDSNEQLERCHDSLEAKVDAINKKLDIVCPQITKHKMRVFLGAVVGGAAVMLLGGIWQFFK